jgi:hypothetical protein
LDPFKSPSLEDFLQIEPVSSSFQSALQAAVEELSKEVLRRNLVAGLFKKAGIEMDYKFSKAS